MFLTRDTIVLLRSLQWSEYNFQSMATKSPVCRTEPGEKYDITEELPPMPLKELHRYIKDRYPQCVKALRGSLLATPAKNAKAGVIVPGEVFIILSSKIEPCMRIRGVGDKLIPVPITSKTEFALIPNDDRDSERILDKDWEGTFTDVCEILQLPILPLALFVRSDFNDHEKQKLSRRDILYNIKVFKTGKLKTRRGIQGVSSDGTTYTFLEAEPVDFSSKQIDTKTTLHWFLKVVQFPQRARVFARGACDIPDISNHSEVTFTDHGLDELLAVKKLGDDPSSIMYINVNSDVKVAAVKLKDCEEYDIIMARRQICIQTSGPYSQTLSKENKYETPQCLVTGSPPEQIQNPMLTVSYHYQNYIPRNERDYYNVFGSKAGKRLGGQTSQSPLVVDDPEESDEHYSLVDESPSNCGDKEPEFPPRHVSVKKSSTDSGSQGGLLQASKPSLLDRPSDIHLRHYVTEKIGKDWGRLATYLELDYSCVEQTTQDVEEQCFRVLMKWKRGKGAEPKTWEVLLKKLDSLGRMDISDEIRRKIENGTLNDF